MTIDEMEDSPAYKYRVVATNYDTGEDEVVEFTCWNLTGNVTWVKVLERPSVVE